MHTRVCLPNVKTKTYPLSFLLRYILFNGIYVFHCDVDVAFNFAEGKCVFWPKRQILG